MDCACLFWDKGSHVRLCSEHHRYFRGAAELASVSKVLKPYRPDFSAIPPHVLENARIRGILVDRLFSDYIEGWLDELPVTREDAAELFLRLKNWWDGKHTVARSQVILADEEIAGTCDVLADDEYIYDLKTISKIAPLYHIQLGAYAQLYYATFNRPVKKLAIIHISKDLRKPKIIPVDMAEALQKWQTVREAYALAKREGLPWCGGTA